MAQPPWPGWTDQTYPQSATQPLDYRSLERYQQPNQPQLPHAQSPAQNKYPFHGTIGPAPIIAELPAPLPVAPATTTPEKQLTEDEQLARKLSVPDQQAAEDEELAKQLQRLEVQAAGNKLNSNVGREQRPVSVALPSPQWTPSLSQPSHSYSMRPHSQSIPTGSSHGPGLMQHRSMQTLRPHPQSLCGSPGTFGPPPQIQSRYSVLPEVIADPPAKTPPTRLPLAPMSNLPEVLVGNATQILEMPSDPGSLAIYLEKHRQVPYPPQWRLAPVVKMYHAQTSITSKANWLDTPESSAWLIHRRTENPANPAPAPYTFAFKRTGGSYRDPRFSWVMQINDAGSRAEKRQRVWSYELRLDLKSGIRKMETLNPGGKINILTTYVHASNYDSLRFVGNDGKAYLWVSHVPMSSTHGSRYDTIRHALFVANRNHPDPLYGDIIADHAYWDGFDGDTRVHQGISCIECQTKPIVGQRWNCKTCSNHDICGLCHACGNHSSIETACRLSLTCIPDETLFIRSLEVDHALVIASLQVLKDWQKHELRRQKSQNPNAFMHSEEAARQHDLGRLSYWRGSDISAKLGAPQRIKSRAETAEAMQNPNGFGGALGNLADAGLAMAAQGQQGGYGGHHGGHHTYGGDVGGGGGDGGGGGG